MFYSLVSRVFVYYTCLFCFVSSQTGTAPIITQVNDNGNGTARVSWLPSAAAADYLLSAEAYTFTETLPGGALTPGGEFSDEQKTRFLNARFIPVNGI